MLWIQTRPQPQSWSLTLRLWWAALRRAPRTICPLDREKTILLTQHCLLLELDVKYWPSFWCCFVFVLPACSDTWMRRLCSPDPHTLLYLLCWTTTTGWLDRQRTSVLSSWLSRKPSSGRPCPTLSWAGSCLLSSTPRVIGPHVKYTSRHWWSHTCLLMLVVSCSISSLRKVLRNILELEFL